MRIQKFTGSSARSIMLEIREALGDEAFILGNRQLPDGLLEFTVGVSADAEEARLVEELHAAAPVPASAAARPAPDARPGAAPWPQAAAAAPFAAPAASVPFASPAPSAPSAPSAPPALSALSAPPAAPAPFAAFVPPASPAPGRAPAPAGVAGAVAGTDRGSIDRDELRVPAASAVAAPSTTPDWSREFAALKTEIVTRFTALEDSRAFDLSATRRELLTALLAGGFSMPLAHELIAHAPPDLARGQVRDWLVQAIAARLSIPAEECLATPGIYALVGPTGVGKTTTVAKMAARCIQLHGVDGVAMITTDSFRIGAHEQLQAFGKLMGVPVHPMPGNTDLDELLTRLADKRIVLIDNIGLSQRDRRVQAQYHLLARSHHPIRRILAISAASQGETLDEVVRHYGFPAPEAPLVGCVVTKVDEAGTLGSAMDAVVRYRLALLYVCDGQRVPQDLHRPQAAALAGQALAQSSGAHSLYAPSPEALSALVRSALPQRPGPAAGGAAPWLNLLLADDGSHASAQAQVDSARRWIQEHTVARLALEGWKRLAQPAAARPDPAELGRSWAAEIRRGAESRPPLIVIHGQVSLGPTHGPGAIRSTLIVDARGSPLGTIWAQYSPRRMHDLRLEMEASFSISQELFALPHVHYFDALGRERLQALAHERFGWLGMAGASTPIRPEGPGRTLGQLAAAVDLHPILLAGDAAPCACGEATFRLPPGDAALRLVVLRPAATPSHRAYLGVTAIPASAADIMQLASCALAGLRASAAIRFASSAWLALPFPEKADQAPALRAMIATQCGAAAWWAADRPLGEFLKRIAGAPRRPSAHTTCAGLMKTFAMLDML